MLAKPPRAKSPVQVFVNRIPRWPVYLLGALPGVWIFTLALNNDLGANPVQTLEHLLGLWAIRFIILGLAVSPLREFGPVNLIRFRRAIGLLAFFYVLAHFTVYLTLDRALDSAAIAKDILKRPYILVGLSALIILLPLAITSNATMIRRLGAEKWSKLHRWVYVAAGLAAAHYVMSVKGWFGQPIIYAAIVAALLLVRVVSRIRRRRRQLTPAAA
jgi:sulfoxide reductase heme-binding subunit YedZ